MHIQLSHNAELKLTAWWMLSGFKEFSGLGLIEKVGDVFHVIDVDLLASGSGVYTEFPPERQRELAPDPRRKLWFHRHPVGNGIPGPHCWSGTDEHTITKEPLGGIPELVHWSVSIVMTPAGWVGRVDLYKPQLRTYHMDVHPNIPTKETLEAANELITPAMRDEFAKLDAEFETLKIRKASRRSWDRVPNPVANAWETWEPTWSEPEVDDNFPDAMCPNCTQPLTFIQEEVSDYAVIHSFECTNCADLFIVCTPDVFVRLMNFQELK